MKIIKRIMLLKYFLKLLFDSSTNLMLFRKNLIFELYSFLKLSFKQFNSILKFLELISILKKEINKKITNVSNKTSLKSYSFKSSNFIFKEEFSFSYLII
jgi:hypothetical protein